MEEELPTANPHEPLLVNAYVDSIMKFVQSREKSFCISQDYFQQLQVDIKEKMRAILIDWLVDVHLKFKLVPETLYLCINLIDRYLERNAVSKQCLQLVGIAALFIASKYEDIYPPELKDFVYVTDNAYTKAELLEMEGKILLQFNFEITFFSPYAFLMRFVKIANLDLKNTFLVIFFYYQLLNH